MTKLIVGIGIPGSGKTTLLKKIASARGHVYISTDAIREELTGDAGNQSMNPETWIEAKKRLTDALASGKTAVFDATFVSVDRRKEFLRFARENGADPLQGVIVEIPLDTALERNASRNRVVPEEEIRKMHHSLQSAYPEIKDGFDDLFIFDQSENIDHAKHDIGEHAAWKRSH